MNILNLNLTPEENDNDKLDSWFSFMNQQFKKMEDSHQKGKINNLLIDNDIETIWETEKE